MSKPEPKNKKLYEKVEREIRKKHPQHSAYRSGLVVKEYKRLGGTYSGSKKDGKLDRWFKEDWRNQRGGIGYQKKSDVYRPTKVVTKDTPTTFSELSDKEIKRAQREKRETGSVRRFKRNPFVSKAQWDKCYAMQERGSDWDCDEFARESPPYSRLPRYAKNGKKPIGQMKYVEVRVAILMADGSYIEEDMGLEHREGASVFDEVHRWWSEEGRSEFGGVGCTVISVDWMP